MMLADLASSALGSVGELPAEGLFAGSACDSRPTLVPLVFLALFVLASGRYRDTRRRGDLYLAIALAVATLHQVGLVLSTPAWTALPGLSAPAASQFAVDRTLKAVYLVFLAAATLLLAEPQRERGIRALVAASGVAISLCLVVHLASPDGAAQGQPVCGLATSSQGIAFLGVYGLVAVVPLASLGGGSPVPRPHLLAWAVILSTQVAALLFAWLAPASGRAALFGEDLFLLHLPLLLVGVALPGPAHPSPVADRRVGAQSDEIVAALGALLRQAAPLLEGHTERSAELAREVAREMGLDRRARQDVYRAMMVRNLGQVSLGRGFLELPRRLTPEEWAQVKQHPQLGADVVSRVTGLGEVARIVRHHHEHWDGTGYPDRLEGEEIPLGARIVSVIDALDAMISGRPYQPARTVVEAVGQLQRLAGERYDPQVVMAALRVLKRRGTPVPPTATGAILKAQGG